MSCNNHASRSQPGESPRIDVRIDDLLRATQLRGRMPAQVDAGASRTPEPFKIKYLAGVDVGSTTVKAVVVDAGNDSILWRDYQRH